MSAHYTTYQHAARALVWVFALFVFGCPGVLWAQTVRVSVEGNEGVYEGEAFTFSVVVSDFDESPEPAVTTPTIEGCADCTVTFQGMNPRISSMIQIINGRRSEYREVTFVYQYQMLIPQAGTYRIGAVTASQGARQVSSSPASLSVEQVAATNDMMLRLTLPDRPLWVGERFLATLDWYVSSDALQHYQQRDLFTGQIQQQLPPHAFDVPAWRLLGLDVRLPPGVAAPSRGQMRFAFPTNAGELLLPAEFSEVNENGRAWGRLRFQVEMTPQQSGALALKPSRVTAQLPVQRGRRLVGMRFKAEDLPKQLEVRAMPDKRPASFRNAVGAGFSIEAKVDRSVVKVGDPIELQVTVRGDADLGGLILPPLDGPGGLSADLFSVAATPPAGEVVEEPGKPPARRFRVPIRIRNAAVKEIPPLPFSFFDPSTGTFKTVHSEPVALSVRDASVVGAQDVVSSAQPPATTPTPTPQKPSNSVTDSTTSNPSKTQNPPRREPEGTTNSSSGVALVGVELGLSDPTQTLATTLSHSNVWGWLAGLYGVPMLLAGWLWYRQRTALQRSEDVGERAARQQLQRALEGASKVAAAESISGIVAALHGLAKALGWSLSAEDRALIGRLETAAYDPQASKQPLSKALGDEVQRTTAAWRRAPRAKDGTIAAGMLLLLALGALGEVRADVTLEDARAAYQSALSGSGSARVQGFVRAQAMFEALAKTHPNSPNLLTDWGHAALGARDMGGAVLAYRRALALDPQQEKARKNLDWIRAQALPSWAVKAEEGGALDALLFWHRRMTPGMCLLWGAVAFGMGVLVLAPWPKPWMRALKPGSVVFGVLWIWLTAAGLAAPTYEREAVVLGDDLPLLVADSASAAKVMEAHVPAGVEVTILEQRAEWSRVEMAGGKQGWLPSSALGLVVER